MEAASAVPSVHWLERKQKVAFRNKYAQGITQSQVVGRTPAWDVGLRGEGEIVGIGDTGVDWDSCYFWDPNGTIPFNEPGDTHRKFHAYITGMDDHDRRNGHGTHVAGMSSGCVFVSEIVGVFLSIFICPSSTPFATCRGVGSMVGDAVGNDHAAQYNGMAPKAKIVFSDLGDGDGDIWLPDDLNEDFFPQVPRARVCARVCVCVRVCG